MVNLTLFCALVGVEGDAFSVKIEDSEAVGDLKDAIKLKKENALKAIDADMLKLFLGLKPDGTWLASSSDDVKNLKRGEKTTVIEDLTHEDKELPGEYGLDEVLEGMPEPKTKEIHVLVAVPEQQLHILS